jgi:pimeloyl-ACP methyl ester carboxylesterase
MRVNNVEICVDAVGDPADPAIVLIGGAASSMDWWDERLVDRLAAAGRYVIRYDSRDTGQSESYPPGRPGYTMSDLVEDAVGVLDALGVTSAQFVGISMGGAVAQLVACAHPDRVDSLVLIATSPVAPTGTDLPTMNEDLRDYFVGQAEPDYTDRDAMVAYGVDVQRHLCGPGYFDEKWVRETAGRIFDRTRNMASSEINHMRMDGDESIRPSMRDISAPALILHGTADPLFALAHGEALAREIPHATLLPLDGVGHQPPPPATWDVVLPMMLAPGSVDLR